MMTATHRRRKPVRFIISCLRAADPHNGIVADFRQVASLLCLLLGGCASLPEPATPRVTQVPDETITLAEPAPLAAPAAVARPTPVVPAAAAPPVRTAAPAPVPEVPAPGNPVPAANPAPFAVTAPLPTPAPGLAQPPPPAIASLSLPSPPTPTTSLPPPPHHPAAPPAAKWLALDRWAQAHGCTTLQKSVSGGATLCHLGSTNGALTLQSGSLIAHWNGVEFRLGFAPQISDGHIHIHPVDARKHLEPLLDGIPRPGKSSPLIVIDPGHGGTDAGSRSTIDAGWEKEYTLDWARRLQGLLLARGWTALLTRSGDTTLALSNRVAFAEQHQADFFISLHFNSAAPNHAEAGLETYALTPAGLPSSLTRGYKDDATLNFPNNEYDAQNLSAALRLQRALLQVNGHADRGVRHARFLTVLQGQNRPAVLVEGGYLSNPQEARRIADPAYRQKLAEAVATALIENAGPSLALRPQPAAAPGGVTSTLKLN